jgi:polyphosphate glucokinase
MLQFTRDPMMRFAGQAAFYCPVKVINDAAMQALGSYRRGRMLFLGLGTGLGSTFIVDGIIEAMELGHLPYKKATYEDYVGLRGLKKHGKKKWQKHVADVVERLVAALEPDEVVLGGGDVKKLKKLPKGCRAGDNANAFLGGFRLWENTTPVASSTSATVLVERSAKTRQENDNLQQKAAGLRAVFNRDPISLAG